MDPLVVRDFWRGRAARPQSRWSGGTMLDFDRSILRCLIKPGARILDLGCGDGALSKSLCPVDGHVTAVDFEPGFSRFFQDDTRFTFLESEVDRFRAEPRFDLALLFGVVTYLEVDQELEVYATLAQALSPEGVAVVKNQCSTSDEYIFSGYSDALNAPYTGRYPSLTDQQSRLFRHFSHITLVEYPPDLNPHITTTHAAFICRHPIIERREW